MTNIAGIPGGPLKSIVESVERVEQQMKDLNADKSEFYKSAKSHGLDPKIVKRVVAERRKRPEDRDEQNHIFDLYWLAVHSPEKPQEKETGTPVATRARTEPTGSGSNVVDIQQPATDIPDLPDYLKRGSA